MLLPQVREYLETLGSHGIWKGLESQGILLILESIREKSWKNVLPLTWMWNVQKLNACFCQLTICFNKIYLRVATGWSRKVYYKGQEKPGKVREFKSENYVATLNTLTTDYLNECSKCMASAGVTDSESQVAKMDKPYWKILPPCTATCCKLGLYRTANFWVWNLVLKCD